MKIIIEIDCETITEFQSHLLKLFEQSIIYCHENEEIAPGVDEFPYYRNNPYQSPIKVNSHKNIIK
jgi:hypothetical protein